MIESLNATGIKAVLWAWELLELHRWSWKCQRGERISSHVVEMGLISSGNSNSNLRLVRLEERACAGSYMIEFLHSVEDPKSADLNDWGGWVVGLRCIAQWLTLKPSIWEVGRYFQASLQYKPQAIWHDSGGWETTVLPGQPDMSLEQPPSSELFFLRKSFGLILNLEETPANSKWTQKVESRVRTSSRPVLPCKHEADYRVGLGSSFICIFKLQQ